uniref:Secreted protein n=1 Tax=Tanacetum cinerariifolium TaxID=118510 RepID=A0A6L2NVL7_TANCI|nr:hypothetical protein [Tanacetum cinerariifolium]
MIVCLLLLSLGPSTSQPFSCNTGKRNRPSRYNFPTLHMHQIGPNRNVRRRTTMNHQGVSTADNSRGPKDSNTELPKSSSTQSHDISCNVFEDAMSRCRENEPHLMLAGQRSFTYSLNKL